MSGGPETLLVGEIRQSLEAAGCIVLKIHGSKYMPAGFPDLVVVRPDGRTVFVEVKIPGRTDGPAGIGLSAIQMSWLWRLGVQGASCGWVDSVAGARSLVLGEGT